MSWFDATGFANLAKSALTSAQKRIDKVLDITEDNRAKLESLTPDESDNFFASFGLKESSKIASTPSSPEIQIKEPSTPTSKTLTHLTTAGGGIWNSFFDTVNIQVSPINVAENVISPDPEEDIQTISQLIETPETVGNPQEVQKSELLVKNEDPVEYSEQILPPAEVECEIPVEITLADSRPESVAELSRTEPMQNVSESLTSSKTFLEPSMMHSQKGWECESLLITESMEGYFKSPEENLIDSDQTPSAESSTLSSCSLEHSGNLDSTLIENSMFLPLENDAVTDVEHEKDSSLSTETSREKFSKTELIIVNENVNTLTLHDIADECQSTESTEPQMSLRDSSLETRMVESIASSTLSNSSSYVSHLLEDAIGDTDDKTEEREAETTGSSEKSDIVKVESENSGHTSSDEIETNTSSDIEVISSPNGEMAEHVSLSPVKQLLSKSGHHSRSDSQSSSSSNSGRHVMFEMKFSREEEFQRRSLAIYGKKKGAFSAPLQLSSTNYSSTQYVKSSNKPVVLNANNACQKHEINSHKCLVAASENNGILQSFASGPGCREISYKEDNEAINNPLQVDKLLKKLAEMAQIIEVRESKLLELSKENVELRDVNALLKQQLDQDTENQTPNDDIDEITQEFTQRIGAMEKKLQVAVQERDVFKKEIAGLQQELSKRQKSEVIKEILREKDQQIQELMEEGEKLSKQQLDNSNKIKKLRAKLKESEELISSQKDKLEKQTIDVDNLRKSISRKDEMEKNQLDTIRQLNMTLQKQEKELAVTKRDLEEAQEKMQSLQVAVDTSFKEMADLHKANVTKDSQAQEAALSAEMAAKEEMRLTLEKYKDLARQEQESLFEQIEDLRLNLARADQQHNRREDNLRQEISELQQRLQEAESRNQELTQSVSAATRPLLRQIENLQATMASQGLSWEKLEKTLTDRLMDAQSQLAVAVEKEQLTSEKHLEISSRVSALESQYTLVRQEKSRLVAELEIERTKAEMLEDNKIKENIHRESQQHSLMEEINTLKKEKVLLENQVEMERIKNEADRKKLLLAQEQLLEKDKKSSPETSNRSSPGPSISRVNSMNDSMSASMLPWTHDEMIEKTLILATSNGNKTSLYDSLRAGSGAPILEYLQSQLKQKEGEVNQLQTEIEELERTREAMARELVDITAKNEQLEEQINELQDLREKYNDTEQRYNAVLQMYGEKAEEAEELRLDLDDVKTMYRAQIEELLQRS